MLARRREQILIMVGLIGLNLLLGWWLGRFWKDYRARTAWLYAGAPAERAANPVAGLGQRGHAQDFSQIVARDFFSPLRGAAPPQSAEEAKAPKLPSLFGTMSLGDGWFALMAAADQPAQASIRVLPGEEIGGYKLVSIGVRSVVIEWQDKKITLDIAESAHRVPEAGARTASASPAPPAVTSSSNTTVAARPFTGLANAGGKTSAPANADAPVGTVSNGQRKVLVPTLFGTATVWVPADRSAPATPQPSEKK
jgi:hypothetical protein